MKEPDRVLSMLGIAMKAHKVVSGEVATENAIKSMTASLVIVTDDASDNTRRQFKNMCDYRDIPIRYYGNKVDIGHAIGRGERSNLAVTDDGIGRVIMGYIDSQR